MSKKENPPEKPKKRKAGPAWEANRKPPFEKGNQLAKGHGRPKGSKNRATILKELMELALLDASGKQVANPLNPKEKRMLVETALGVAIIQKALKGNVEAYREIMDSVHGKMTEKKELTGADGEPLMPVVILNDVPRA